MRLTTDLFIQLAYALGTGVLIGLERTLVQDTQPAAREGETAPKPSDVADFMGVRTFAILSLVGYGAALANDFVPWTAPIILAAVAVLIVAQYQHTSTVGWGITTEAAALGATLLGLMCHYHPRAAVVIALVVTVVLAAKRFTKELTHKMSRVELTDTLKFLVIVLIVLPMLPSHALDPFGAFNPRKVCMLVVLISGIGFVGYFLTRILGAKRGLGLTGLLGGLTSSTAVTASMGAQARVHKSLGMVCAFSTLIANATMFARVLVVVSLIAPVLLKDLLLSLGAMGATVLVYSGVIWFLASRTEGNEKEEAGSSNSITLSNPFSIGPALKFAAFFVVILFVAKVARQYFGDSGLYAAAGLSGLADVDAITMSIAEQSRDGSMDLGVGALAITIAIVANSIVKSGIAIYTGGWNYGRWVAAGLGLGTVVGLGLAILT